MLGTILFLFTKARILFLKRQFFPDMMRTMMIRILARQTTRTSTTP